jgi:hypothetical protein
MAVHCGLSCISTINIRRQQTSKQCTSNRSVVVTLHAHRVNQCTTIHSFAAMRKPILQHSLCEYHCYCYHYCPFDIRISVAACDVLEASQTPQHCSTAASTLRLTSHNNAILVHHCCIVTLYVCACTCAHSRCLIILLHHALSLLTLLLHSSTKHSHATYC